MVLHIFNPQHDMALAANRANLTPPRIIRQMADELCFLPALWADRGDIVVVSDEDEAKRRLTETLPEAASNGVHLVFKRHLKTMLTQGEAQYDVAPWGWDKPAVAQLLKLGVPREALPTDNQLDQIRQLSHRRWAKQALLPPLLQLDSTIGQACNAATLSEVEACMAQWGKVVVKSPWSCSGRGVRMLTASTASPSPDGAMPMTPQTEHWISNIIRTQGSIVVEPLYNKVKDFGMEFFSDGRGRVTYQGLSVFQTHGSAYTGNLIADEATKARILQQYVPPSLLESLNQTIAVVLSERLGYIYHGPLGVDMMVVADGGRTLVCPCVELNLRMTMGHVALLLARRYPRLLNHTMGVRYESGHYSFAFSV